MKARTRAGSNGAQIVHWVYVLALVAIYAAGYAWSAPHTDTADELLRAYEIREHIRFPLEGPPLGQVLHLGPAWFYVVAAAFYIHESWLWAALFIGLVCGLKFPLAYWCGRKLADPGFGILWCTALAVPGWASFEPLIFLNPNAVAMAELGTIALALAFRERATTLSFFWLGLWLALAAHIHPTAAPMAVLAAALMVRHRHRVVPWRAVSSFAAGFVLPFAPYAISQIVAGFPDWRAVSGYVEHEVSIAGGLQAPTILWNWMTGGIAVLARYFFGASQGMASTAGAVLASVYVVAAVAALRDADPRTRRLAQASMIWLVATAIWIGMMRKTTPLQFTWVLVPPFAALLALGLRALQEKWRGQAVTAVAAAVIVAGSISVTRAMAIVVSEGEGRLPSSVLDINGSLGALEFRDVWFPAYAHGRLGTALCDAPKPLALHGHLAYIVDKDLALDMLLVCGGRSGVTLGGNGSPAWLGMTRPFWDAIGASPECSIGSLGIATSIATPVAQPPTAVAAGDTYLPRKPSGNKPRAVTFSFAFAGERGVLVTNMLGGYEYFRADSARLGGTELAPAASNDLSVLYRAPDGALPGDTWNITVTASRPEAIDIAAIARSSGASAVSGRCP
jgi:hypothetical protein